ncbi:MAG: hypothetical protein ACLR23_07875 [Clostridia bacterium]|uniref:Uncharacterized protein n=1 Tax=Bianquea renquensis TaxID=2763661 RepID=A0A926DRT7_9FIRM|nr:hypothetical protein [Bianquea renquensis]MBC8542619.1 hypothetical protein [Bianquea renquensis]
MILEAKELWKKANENILVSSYVGARANRDAPVVAENIRRALSSFIQAGAKNFVIGIPYIENLKNHFYEAVVQQIHELNVPPGVRIGVLTSKRNEEECLSCAKEYALDFVGFAESSSGRKLEVELLENNMFSGVLCYYTKHLSQYGCVPVIARKKNLPVKNIYLDTYKHMLTYKAQYVQDTKYKHLMMKKSEYEGTLRDLVPEEVQGQLKDYFAVMDELLTYVIEVSNQIEH